MSNIKSSVRLPSGTLRMLAGGLLLAGMLLAGSFMRCACGGLAVDPTVTEVSFAPGTTATGEYTLMNTGDNDLIVTVEVVDWLARYLQRDASLPVESWITFGATEITVPAGTMRKVPYTVSVPRGANGEQVAQVFFAFKNAVEEESFNMRIGVILYLGIKGAERIDAAITDLVIKPVRNEDGTYTVYGTVTIQNTGSVHIRPSGAVKIRKHHQAVGSIVLKSGKGIYAETTDTISAASKPLTLAPGTYEAEAEIDCSMYDIQKAITAKTFFTI